MLPLADPALTERRYELLELTDELEIWAIHWPQGRRLELHDHGGSVGALWVVAGTLEEHYIQADRTVARRTLAAGRELGATGAMVSGSGPTCAFLAADAGHARDLAVSLTGAGVCRAVVRVHGPVPGAAVVASTEHT